MSSNRKHSGTWKEVAERYRNQSGTWKAVEEKYRNDAGTWKQVFNAVEVSSITISGPTTPGAGTQQDYTVSINYSDSSTSSDCTELTWSIVQKNTQSTPASIVDVAATDVTVDVGSNNTDPEFALRAEAENGVFDELDVSVDSIPLDALVLMADGSRKPLGDIQVGDLVRAYDPYTEKVSDRPVSFVLQHHEVDQVIDVYIENGGSFSATPEHRCWVRRDGCGLWLNTEQICPGDELMTSGLVYTPVVSVRRRAPAQRERSIMVGNIEVANAHVYFADDVLLHNANSDIRLKDNIRWLRTIHLSNGTTVGWYSFQWRDSGMYDEGVIAQEVLSVLPSVVHRGADEAGTLSVNYGQLGVYVLSQNEVA